MKIVFPGKLFLSEMEKLIFSYFFLLLNSNSSIDLVEYSAFNFFKENAHSGCEEGKVLQKFSPQFFSFEIKYLN